MTSPTKKLLEWQFNINPVAASRPRVSRWGAFYVGTYKVFREIAAEAVWNTIGNGFVPLSNSLSVSIELYIKRPKKTDKEYPRPDIDNFAKAILDTMNGKIWEDDTQIISLYVTKQWAEKDSEGYFILSVSN